MGAKVTVHFAENGVSTGGTQVIDTRSLGDAQNNALNRLANQYATLYAAGFNYSGKNFQIDAASQANINAAASMALVVGASWPASYVWIASDNSQFPITTAAAMTTFGVMVGQYVTGMIMNNRALKDAIAALSDIASCDAFDVTQGWPTNAG